MTKVRCGRAGRLLACASACAILASGTAQAIYINERAAQELGFENIWDSENRYPAVASLSLGGNKYCTGTLIDPRTVLTASHCLANPSTEVAPHVPMLEVRFGADARIDSPHDRRLGGALIHPDYDTNIFAQHDIAMVSLSGPVHDVEPVELLAQGERTAEFGQEMLIVGYGAAGLPGREMDIDFRRRYAVMQFGGLNMFYSDGHPVLYTQFRDPDNPGRQDVLGLDAAGFPVPFLQGSSAPGDSGGPIFVERDGDLVQVGTVIGGFYPGGVGDARVPNYPIINLYTPLELFGDWVRANAAYRATTAAEGDWNWSDADAWTDTLDRNEVPDNVAGSFDGRGSLGRFYGVRLTNPGAVTLDMDATVDDLRIADAEALLDIPAGFGLDVVAWTAVDQGTLAVDGRLRAGVVTIENGLLRGTGVVETAFGVINHRGVVMPGTENTAAPLTVDGDYWHGPDATLWTRIGDDDTGALEATGRSVLHGALVLDRHETLIDTRSDYAVLQAAGGIDGRFSTVKTPLAFLEPTVTYTGTEASARFERNDVAFAAAADTANGRAAATALAGAAPSSLLNRNVLNLRRNEAPDAFAALSAETYASASSALMSQAGMLRNVLSNRLRRDTPAPEASTPWLGYGPVTGLDGAEPSGIAGTTIGTWALAHATDGDIDGDGNASGVDHRTSGIFGGIAAEARDWKAGVAFGYTESDFTAAAPAGGGDAESFHLGVHGAVDLGGVELSGGLLHSWHDLTAQRTVALPAFATTAEADYEARTLQAFGEAAYRFDFGAAGLTPFAGLAVLDHRADGFADTGGIARLSVSKSSHTQVFSALGVRANATIYRGDAVELSVRASAGWNHAFRDLAPVVSAAFANGAPFASAGVAIDRDTLALSAGLGAHINERVRLDVDYAGQLGDRTQDHSILGRVTVDF